MIPFPAAPGGECRRSSSTPAGGTGGVRPGGRGDRRRSDGARRPRRPPVTTQTHPRDRRPRPAVIGGRRENIPRLAAWIGGQAKAGERPNRERCRSGVFPGGSKGGGAPLARARMFYIACAGLTAQERLKPAGRDARETLQCAPPRTRSPARRGEGAPSACLLT